MLEPAYRYRAYCERVIDGDTVVLRVDLGFHVAASIHARLRGVNAPEARTVEGEQAAAWLRDLLKPAVLFWENGGPTPLIVESYRDRRSFARWVCDIWLLEDARNLAEALVEAGHGTEAL